VALLAAIEREARAARSPRELAFLLVNRVRAVLPHDLSVYWADRTTMPMAVSGVSAPDSGAPTVLWLPVDLGRRVMTIADPNAVELSVSLPVDEAVAVAEGQAVAFHLNIAPLQSVPVVVTHVGYEPLVIEETGLLAYRLRARFTGPEATPRVGLRGTARRWRASADRC